MTEVTLFVLSIGAAVTGFSGIKYRRHCKHEYWAEKKLWMIVHALGLAMLMFGTGLLLKTPI
ncbi:MAG: hypothetical protein HGB11_04125 [Chlorobiales bacterium]|nr:hypothetical protein [Chlorobiales bacterium]